MMRFLPALFFIAVGIWIAIEKPDIAAVAMVYINMAIDFISNLLNGE
ncbi:hypothetical protein [Alteromonas gilva]|uniref:Uncharacterized protein n=1 Tax=Alteromonas gilva TaxID=2987522 RepID=A0ABT5L7B0_9ALTE|nr:hypothetical protein [Alteromonas gilva]MDC8832953.1 hypothetical protein [Alteromonas gilva]